MFNKISDEEFVTRVRRQYVRLARWRPWLIGFHSVMFLVLVGLLIVAADLAAQIGQIAGAQGFAIAGFVCGSFLGFMLGLQLIHFAHSLANALFGMRTQHLLLRYHDALADLAIEAELPFDD